MSDHPALHQMLLKLGMRAPLGEADRAAILALPYVERTYESPTYILREGEPAKKHCSFIMSGLAFRQKLTNLGARQIVSIHMAGDFLDLQHLFLNCADHSVQALTRVQAADIPREALQDLILQHPAIGRAMWIDALVDASIFREWVLNVGRRDGRARIAHLLCEFALKMEATGAEKLDGYELPMTQEQIGDAVGLTSVHVNRMLKAFGSEGIIEHHKRAIRIVDWERLQEVGDFSALYMHLDQAAPVN